MYKVLHIGCGNRQSRRVLYKGRVEDFSDSIVTTLDIDPNCGADVVMDLNGLGKRSLRHPFGKKLPFKNNTFDEIAAYDCLEHIGEQGDWRGYFKEFSEYHRVLKPEGHFCIIVPTGEDNYADPGHVRFFSMNHFGFLSQKFYESNIKTGTTCTDYRWYWKKNFDVFWYDKSAHHIGVVLQKA